MCKDEGQRLEGEGCGALKPTLRLREPGGQAPQEPKEQRAKEKGERLGVWGLGKGEKPTWRRQSISPEAGRAGD